LIYLTGIGIRFHHIIVGCKNGTEEGEMETPEQVILSLGLVVGTIALSLWQRLALTGAILVAVGRSILQMIVFSYLIAVTFSLQSPIATLMAVLLLVAVSSLLTRNQINENIPFLLPIVVGALIVGSGLAVAYTVAFVFPTTLWYAPQIIVPLVGILVSSSMSASAIAADQLIKTLNSRRSEIETHLSLGARPEQAIAPYRIAAIRSAVIPQISALTILGLGLLPSFMAGELLAGIHPLQAGAYQLLILIMSLFATLLTTVLLTMGISRQFLNSDGQLIQW
jgi:putative ABC transport system permease protein